MPGEDGAIAVERDGDARMPEPRLDARVRALLHEERDAGVAQIVKADLRFVRERLPEYTGLRAPTTPDGRLRCAGSRRGRRSWRVRPSYEKNPA